MCLFFFFFLSAPPINSPTPAGCTVQPKSDTTYLEMASDATLEGFSPTGLPPLHTHFRHQPKGHIVPCASDQLAIGRRFPWPLPWVWWRSWRGSQGSKKHSLTFTSLLSSIFRRTLMNSQKEGMRRAGCVGRAMGLALSERAILPALHVLIGPEALWALSA